MKRTVMATWLWASTALAGAQVPIDSHGLVLAQAGAPVTPSIPSTGIVSGDLLTRLIREQNRTIRDLSDRLEQAEKRLDLLEGKPKPAGDGKKRKKSRESFVVDEKARLRPPSAGKR